ncbi:MAG: ATP-binding cassette domain-containing protein [Candidatus Limnocylindrales bacterium]|nr:ATP-binding cassette domain-containing protein [Candidatus Limnocylindrales bacterium]
MSDNTPLVEVEDLTFRYRRATEPAIRNVSLTVTRGEVILVAGPSGCGKSTLIRAINGLIPHAYPGELGGSVRLEGRPTTELKLRDIALTVGTVLQDPGKQIVGATVEAELAFGPENLGVPRDEIRELVRLVSEQAGIEPLLGRETAALSGGERQLLAMAGILMMRPRLYVVDEPLANLDPLSAARLLAILRALADRGNAVIIVEHRVEEALELRPDRVLYLDAGAPRYVGPVDGFLRIADPRAVKLSFDVVLERARAGGLAAAAGDGTEPRHAPAPSDADHESAEGPARLEFRAVDASIGDHQILHGVDASLGRREVVAVLGPNGSGKTTAFRTAMQLLPVSAGRILVDGVDAKGRGTASLATIFGYVFQSPSQMLFARTVREELAFGPTNLRRDPATFDALIADCLRRTALDGLEGILERPPLTLSFGQQKRLALAIALALQPATLILDEPSAGQDHQTAEAFMREVLAIPGLESVYFITHDVDLALTHADRILLFRDGRIVADGPPKEIIVDEARWRACNLTPTSLMQANARWGGRDDGFLDAESLALRIVASEQAAPVGAEGGSASTLPD